jgi:hypothetical protein
VPHWQSTAARADKEIRRSERCIGAIQAEETHVIKQEQCLGNARIIVDFARSGGVDVPDCATVANATPERREQGETNNEFSTEFQNFSEFW